LVRRGANEVIAKRKPAAVHKKGAISFDCVSIRVQIGGRGPTAGCSDYLACVLGGTPAPRKRGPPALPPLEPQAGRDGAARDRRRRRRFQLKKDKKFFRNLTKRRDNGSGILRIE
jgi:hypothetical protein